MIHIISGVGFSLKSESLTHLEQFNQLVESEIAKYEEKQKEKGFNVCLNYAKVVMLEVFRKQSLIPSGIELEIDKSKFQIIKK